MTMKASILRFIFVPAMLMSAVSLTACGQLKDKHTNTETKKDPTKPYTPLPGDWDKDPGDGTEQGPGDGAQNPPPTPTPAPVPVPAPAPTVVTALPTQTDSQFDILGGTVPSTYCKPNPDGSFPDSVEMTGGDGNDPEGGNYAFGQGGACVKRPVRETWAAAMNDRTMTWDRSSSKINVNNAPPAGIVRMFDIEYSHTEKVLGIPITVNWNMNWLHSLKFGTPDAPRRVLINYSRYAGTSHIPYWQGTIVLDRVSDDVTGVWVRNQIRADQQNSGDAQDTARQIIGKLRGEAPNWDALPK